MTSASQLELLSCAEPTCGAGRFDDSNCSGKSSSGVISTMRPPFRNRTRSTCISASH